MQIALVGALVALIGAAIAAYAWDRAQANDIATGIRVGGIPIGGLNEKQAAHKLRIDLVKPIEQPITVRFEGTSYVLGASRLNVHADVPAMLAAAHDASRAGGLPSRLWREATGGEVEENLPAHVGYSKAGVSAFVDAVAKQVDRAPTEASVQPAADSLNLVPGKDGVSLDKAKLTSMLVRELGSGDARRVLQAPVAKTKSTVTTRDLAAKYPTYLTVDRGSFQLRLWRNLKLAHTYTIAVGMQGLETPAGTYTIDDKQVNPSWHVPDSAWAGKLAGKVIPPGPADPIKARWMGFYNGAGIHGTDEIYSLGSAASHGCIRMAIPDVIALYDQVPLGTPIYIG
ncbi:MAG: L,D-transpeptidase ErfK/SrfK [Solirubrobacterales bacterium]|nr:L,D-transpeptidase ErfK/SrfK [Solirubrobacterales bacterium]